MCSGSCALACFGSMVHLLRYPLASLIYFFIFFSKRGPSFELNFPWIWGGNFTLYPNNYTPTPTNRKNVNFNPSQMNLIGYNFHLRFICPQHSLFFLEPAQLSSTYWIIYLQIKIEYNIFSSYFCYSTSNFLYILVV